MARSDWLLRHRTASAIYVQATREARVNYEKMVSQLATVSNEEILKTNEDAVPANTKKATKFGLSVFASKVLLFLTPNLPIKQVKKFLFANAN